TYRGLDTSTKPTYSVGAGLKWRVNKSGSVGLRFDVRGLMSDNAQFHVVAADHTLWGVQPTVGINFWFGKQHQDKEFERTVTVTYPAPAPLIRNNISATNIQGGGGEVCGRPPVNPIAAPRATPADRTIRYQFPL